MPNSQGAIICLPESGKSRVLTECGGAVLQGQAAANIRARHGDAGDAFVAREAGEPRRPGKPHPIDLLNMRKDDDDHHVHDIVRVAKIIESAIRQPPFGKK
eukprot:scaffold32475_cov27-Tisochrysis_lutea.AAC.2